MTNERPVTVQSLTLTSPWIGPTLKDRGWPAQVLIGIACAAVAGVMRFELIPLLGDQAPFMPFVLAVLVACVLSGPYAGIIATFVSACVAIGIIAPWPARDHLFASAAHTVFFIIVSAMICIVVRQLQRASHRERELLIAADNANKILELERRHLSLAMKAASAGVFDWDIKKNSNVWSDELLQLYGFAPGEFEQTYDAWLNCIYPDDLAAAKAITSNALASGHAKGEFRIVRRDTGELRWLHSRSMVLYDDQHEPERCLGVNVDITDLKQTEATLREREACLNLIYNNASDCLYLVRIEADQFRFVSANDTFLRVSGYTREQVEGSLMEQIVPASNHDLVRAKYQEVIATRQKLIYEDVAQLPAGRRFGEITLVPIAGPDGAIQLILGAIKDVTAMREAEASLHEAAKRKDEFLAMLAHELRNPLAPIYNIAHLFASSRLDESSMAQYSAILIRQTQHMKRMVDDLLDVSRITRGAITLKREYAVLDSIVDGALETLRPVLETKQQMVKVSRADKPIVLMGDTARLNQVFVNLLNNAAKYSGAATQIDVALEHADDKAIVRIRDRGIGMDAATLPHVFELFVQANQSLDRAHGGLGVGLTIVKRLVEMHDGSVEAHSAGLGQGSELVVRLPVVNSQVQRA